MNCQSKMKPKKKKITNRWLLQLEAPEGLIEWIKNKKERDPLKILRLLTKDNADQIVWLITKIMQDKDCIAYAVYAAEQIIDIYEEQYPGNKRLRVAIEAAKRCRKKRTKENKAFARLIAKTILSSKITGAAQSAALSAAYTAHAAATASLIMSRAAILIAVNVASSAVKLKILAYGLDLLGV